MPYAVGHIKHNPAENLVALRTIFPDDPAALKSQAWLVATPNRGATFVKTSDVEEWEDLFVPE